MNIQILSLSDKNLLTESGKELQNYERQKLNSISNDLILILFDVENKHWRSIVNKILPVQLKPDPW